jgi:hypothetical protein
MQVPEEPAVKIALAELFDTAQLDAPPPETAYETAPAPDPPLVLKLGVIE